MKNKSFIKKLTISSLLITILSSCAIKLAYNNADFVLIWILDDYFGLTKHQKNSLDIKIKKHLAWHKKEELPVYSDFLKEIKIKTQDGLTSEEINWIFQRYDDLYENLIKNLSSDAVTFLTSLNKEQIQNLEQKMKKDNEKLTKTYLENSPEERLQKRAERTLNFVKDLIGELTPEQEKKITELSKSLPSTTENWLENRKRRQKMFLEILNSSKNASELETRLQDLILNPEKSRSPEYQKHVEEMNKKTREMILIIDKMATPEQRLHALKKIQEYINDIQEMVIS
jgi:cell division protein FtsI/penicillin-binding protein 2